MVSVLEMGAVSPETPLQFGEGEVFGLYATTGRAGAVTFAAPILQATAQPIADPIAAAITGWEANSPKLDPTVAEVFSGTLRLEKNARETRNPSGYVVAAQFQMMSGNLRRARTTLEEAVTLFPSFDGPHYGLAELYYRVAFFDAIWRGAMMVKRVRINGTSVSPLGSLGLDADVEEMFTHLSPPVLYRSFLEKAGFTKAEQNSLGNYINVNRIRKASSSNLLSLSGINLDKIKRDLPNVVPPNYIPVLEWKPDTRNRQILQMARSQFQRAIESMPMPIPQGAPQVFDRDNLNLLRSRLDSMVAK